MTGRLLLEAEVAERLRCSVQKVKRLRLSGALPYIPGRPVTIDEDDVEAYLERLKVSTASREKKSGSGESLEDAKRWAKTAVLLKRDKRPRSKS